MKFLFAEDPEDPSCYIQHGPTVGADIPNLPSDVNVLGEYENMLLGKLLDPINPVICVTGGMGCGKTTTMTYLVRQVLRRMSCVGCAGCEGSGSERWTTAVTLGLSCRARNTERPGKLALHRAACQILQGSARGGGVLRVW